MAKTQIRNSQVLPGILTNNEIAAGAAIASSKLANWGADRNAGGFKLTNAADPVSGSDGATKQYVDNVVQGLAPKGSVRVMTSANIALTGTQTIDGVALSVGDLVLVTAQSTGSQNGPYVVASGAWTRALNFDAPNDAIKGAYWLVDEGTSFGGTGWLLGNAAGYVIGTDALTFVQTFGPGDIVAGAGISRTGNTFNIGANADGSMIVNADDIQVRRDGAGAIAVSASGIAVAVGANTGLAITANSLGVKLNGASLTLGAAGLSVTTPVPTFITRETPTGAVDGVNVTFTLANTPTAGSEQVFLNGILQEPGAGNDYTIASGTITYLTAPSTGDRIRVSYRF